MKFVPEFEDVKIILFYQVFYFVIIRFRNNYPLIKINNLFGTSIISINISIHINLSYMEKVNGDDNILYYSYKYKTGTVKVLSISYDCLY